MLTKNDILMGRDKTNPITPKMEENLNNLLKAINSLLTHYKKNIKISSGYRPASINNAVGGATNSAHQTCEAVDIVDNNREFAIYCLDNINLLKKLGLYMEDPRWTPTWVHLQIRPTKSGKIVFIPNNQPPLDKNFFHKTLEKI
ncbi:MAG: D-Ala-D-Ala carboxypeptidase family metallohydrolase [Bacteroidia bacterium]|nr:D-Ala-D-Ala carboxypeptidase family metallohydrolase [Bacteroidia bacterium]